MYATLHEKEVNRATLSSKRKDYMEGRISHKDYYLWLSDWLGITDRDIHPYISRKAVENSTDPNLNDITLTLWDMGWRNTMARATAKGIHWSPSDSVCCLKALAEKWRTNKE